MNKKSRKALSPVVASIILIAVTVAVSIAVAAWMGALTFNFMAVEQGQVTNLAFTTGTALNGTVVVTFNNTGTNPIIINEVWVNNAKQASVSPALGTSTLANSGIQYNVTMLVVAGAQYEVKLVSSKGNAFPRSGMAPT